MTAVGQERPSGKPGGLFLFAVFYAKPCALRIRRRAALQAARRTPTHFELQHEHRDHEGNREQSSNCQRENVECCLSAHDVSHCGRRKLLSLEFYARGTALFPARIAARRFVAPWMRERFASRCAAQPPVIAAFMPDTTATRRTPRWFLCRYRAKLRNLVVSAKLLSRAGSGEVGR